MVFVITQQTFDEAVQENINDLGLSPEEALTEAIAQFKAQGVDLSQIITVPGAKTDIDTIVNSIKRLTELKDQPITNECHEQLNLLKQECDKGIEHRVQAGKLGAYDVILDIYLKSDADKTLKVLSLKTMLSLMTKQPDLFDDRGAQVILANLNNKSDIEIQKWTLKWCKECNVMHEMNRQKLMDLQIVDKLTILLKEPNSEILKEVLTVFRTLILDDDLRVEFGRAHEHARIIATEILSLLIELIGKFKSNDSLVNDLLMTLSALLVRAEFCAKVEEAGGVELLQDIMANYIGNEKVTRQCFKLIKALCGSDECKVRLIQKGLAVPISNSLNAHQGSIQTASAGLSCVAALTLRSPDNSKALFEASILEVIVEIMRKYPSEKPIQKTASWAVRNMVSRSRYLNKHFLDLGVEDLLRQNLAKFKDLEYDIKAALRDLECDVQLKEEWTGKGGKLTSDSIKLA